jgi:hypothetical protein
MIGIVIASRRRRMLRCDHNRQAISIHTPLSLDNVRFLSLEQVPEEGPRNGKTKKRVGHDPQLDISLLFPGVFGCFWVCFIQQYQTSPDLSL